MVSRVMADEIEIVSYQPEWAALFAAERVALLTSLPTDLVLNVEHFGSTAIPGMDAKPIIDILVAVRSLAEARESFPSLLAALQYDFWAENPKLDRLFFVKGLPLRGPRRTNHLHVCEHTGEMWGQLAFRDNLIAHPAVAEEYARVKRRLALKFREDREAYTDAKSWLYCRGHGCVAWR
jgi:GrpB-like predicted nucleotidyltransferase (UPF0157 family)